jgi:hypothetical protein
MPTYCHTDSTDVIENDYIAVFDNCQVSLLEVRGLEYVFNVRQKKSASFFIRLRS